MLETRLQLIKRANEAEERALKHFKKLNEIEIILDKSEKNKEMYFETLKKIKNVVYKK